MTEAAWEEIPGEQYEDFWAPFDARYRFRPRMQESEAGIDEPLGSVTIDLSPIFAGQRSQCAAGEQAVNALALLAMTEVFPADQRLLVLDWQHPSFWFGRIGKRCCRSRSGRWRCFPMGTTTFS